jgi:5-oxoprolinase (ATP-hydrolysing) subunit A
MRFDINCDLGEGEPRARTEALMRLITSANVACGGHAGDLDSMQRCVALARRHGVKLGAHPGTWDRQSFGRAESRITAAELELLLLQQVGALERVAKDERVRLHHIKLHGALHHAAERDEQLARAYVEIVARRWPRVVVYALAEGTVARVARGRVKIWQEAFLDRNYLEDGSLVPRAARGALLREANEVRARLTGLSNGVVKSVTGKVIPVRARTLCIHADGEMATRFARIAARER